MATSVSGNMQRVDISGTILAPEEPNKSSSRRRRRRRRRRRSKIVFLESR
jgi:hypothetical protein